MTGNSTPYSPRGSQWHRWDLHVHTPASFDYQDKSITDQQIVDCLVQAGLRAVAVTDHHAIDVLRITRLQKLGADKLTVFPGIELRDDHGGDPIHYICIFPETCNLNDVWTTLQGKLELTAMGIAGKGGDDKVYVPIEQGAKEAQALGGIVSIHAGAKSNSIEGISNKEQFQQRIKYDITNACVDLMEIGQLKDIDRHYKTIFPATGLEKPLVLCSDNHRVTEYSTKAPLWFRADPTFRGLLMVLREPRERVFIGVRPPELIRVEQNRTKYFKGVSFQRRASTPPSEQWFGGKVEFNSGLVAIVGNKGSGKSALSDILGLLGATKNGDAFSFLSKERFRHPSNNLASHFDATIEWEAGDTATKCLADAIKPEEVERLKYLPQDHVETVCNELAGLGEEGFEQELKAVIFSHVPEAERLGHSTLDDLVRFKTGEKQKRIDSLLKQLRDLSRSRTLLEAQADPTVRKELTEKINRRKLELEALDKAKPEPVADPAADGSAPVPDATLLDNLKTAEASRTTLATEISKQAEALRVAERRNAVAKRLLEKLDNFEKEYEVFNASLIEDATELGLTADELVSLTITRGKPEGIRDSAATDSKAAKDALDKAQPPGLRKQLERVEAKLAELQTQLDAPNRAYQAYLKALSEWQTQRAAIEGTPTDAESLKGLEHSVTALDELPGKIVAARDQQVLLALQIHSAKVDQAAVYRNLYAAVQGFIDSHVLAKDKLKLEFRAELTSEDFPGRLLAALALNRKGSFMGVDEGRAKAESFVQATTWEGSTSVKAFLTGVDEALHTDQREGQGGPVQLKDQLAKGRKPEEVFDTLYGLEYIRPRYILRWEGKDLSMLSPGERGTLLLVFYLLIDKSDLPLIIDQPEGNLDNHTVAKVLVECIKEARYRATAGVRAINELKPILGLELTATPQVESGGRSVPFKNIIYSYPLAAAMTDGFVKEPAVATRENFDAGAYTAEGLEKVKLEDGVRIHENSKVELEVYARNNDKPIVKPFMLVVATDTTHANALQQVIEGDEFFEGRYKGKVIQVHSNIRGEEKDDVVQQLLTVEHPDNPVEIVIHVNMLKEGWDVTNLYTIVPLRAANSRTLVEQSIGRGLRLPYGKRVGVPAVDRLTIVSHDKFQEIIDHANDPNSIIRAGVVIGRDIPEAGRKAIEVKSAFEEAISGGTAPTTVPGRPAVQQRTLFENPHEQDVAKATYQVIQQYERLNGSHQLQDAAVQQEIVEKVQELIRPAQGVLEGVVEPVNVAEVVQRTTALYCDLSIDIPKIIVVPTGEVACRYEDFDLDVRNINYPPVEQDILIQHLHENQRYRLQDGSGIVPEKRPEDYLVRGLIDFDDISYDQHAALLYKLAGQVVRRLREYLAHEDDVTNVLQYHQQPLVNFIHAQMQQHFVESATAHAAQVTRGFRTLRANNYSAAADENMRNFRAPVPEGERSRIGSMVFGGFGKCLYPVQKFDADPERRFAVLLENETAVLKWFKPAKGDFQIFYKDQTQDHPYEPDFVVETMTAKLLCEPKRATEMTDPVVLAKAAAAATWCRHATAHANENGGKPWRYLLIPHDQIQDQMSLSGLSARYEVPAR